MHNQPHGVYSRNAGTLSPFNRMKLEPVSLSRWKNGFFRVYPVERVDDALKMIIFVYTSRHYPYRRKRLSRFLDELIKKIIPRFYVFWESIPEEPIRAL